MRFFNQRLVSLARRRHAAGCYGRRNVGMRYFVPGGFAPDASVMRILRMGMWRWLKAEAHGARLPRVTEEKPVAETALALQKM